MRSKQPRLSHRADRIHAQPMFDMLARAQALEATGARVIHLEIGDTRGFRNERFARLLAAAAPTADHGYTASAGLPRLRRAVAAAYGAEKQVSIGPERVVIGPANALISQALTVLTDPGDAVAIPDPGFPTYWLAAEHLELRALGYPLHEREGWNPSLDEVAWLLDRSGVRAIIVNTPSNPLGIALDAERVERIVDMALERGVAVIFDETYRRLIHGPAVAQPRHRDEVVYLQSYSKEAAIPGFRCGSAVAPAAVCAKLAELGSLVFSCQPPLLQDVLAAYLEDGAGFDAELRRAMAERVAWVDAALGLRPTAAFYAFVNIERSGLSADAFADRLLREHGVCVCPGTAFGTGGAQHVRVTLSGVEAELREGLARLAAFSAGVQRRGDDRAELVA